MYALSFFDPDMWCVLKICALLCFKSFTFKTFQVQLEFNTMKMNEQNPAS